MFAWRQIFAPLRGGMAAFAPFTLERVVAFPLIVGAVGGDLFDLSGRVLKQIRQGFGISDIVRAGHDANDFQRRFIIAEVEFEPGPAFPDAVNVHCGHDSRVVGISPYNCVLNNKPLPLGTNGESVGKVREKTSECG